MEKVTSQDTQNCPIDKFKKRLYVSILVVMLVLHPVKVVGVFKGLRGNIGREGE